MKFHKEKREPMPVVVILLALVVFVIVICAAASLLASVKMVPVSYILIALALPALFIAAVLMSNRKPQ